MKKILFVSDYITNIGGIENYIQNSSDLMIQSGDDVRFLGLETELVRNKKFRQLLLLFTGFNIYIGLRFLYIYYTYRPDIIYFHSITRFIGWFPVWISGLLPAQKIIMYHDLGFITPYPSDTYDTAKLPKSWTWPEFLESNYIHNINISFIKDLYIKGIIGLKFISISVWRFFAIRNIDKHLVPSPFMTDILANRGIKKQSIFVLGHFGSRDK